MKKGKNSGPKRIRWKKTLVVFSWILVLFWTLGSARGFSLAEKVNGMTAEKQVVQQEVKEENFAISPGAETFAENFLEEYLTWTQEDYQERVERLAPYLREGVDEQAGLRFDKVTGNSNPEMTELWEVSDTGDNTSSLLFRVTHVVKTTEEVKGKDKQVTKKESVSKPIEKWVKVPLITDGKTFLVNGIPLVTSKPAAAEIKPIEETAQAEQAKAETTAKINDFLATFFKQYSTGTLDELQFLTTDADVRPLDGVIIFKEVEKTTIVKIKESSYVVEAEVVFDDEKTKSQLLQSYTLEVSEENGRWQVIKIN